MGFKVICTTWVRLTMLVAASIGINAADPELLTDFKGPDGVNASALDGSFFTSMLLRNETANPGPFATVKPANFLNFPALEGLGVSYALLTFPPGTVNRPHTHPRGTEAFFVMEGTIDVGLLDSTNKLFKQTLYKGDIFVFPRGLVHFQINWDPKVTVQALGAFSSSSPGTIVLPQNLFGSNEPINDEVLARSFQVSQNVIKQLKKAQL